MNLPYRKISNPNLICRSENENDKAIVDIIDRPNYWPKLDMLPFTSRLVLFLQDTRFEYKIQFYDVVDISCFYLPCFSLIFLESFMTWIVEYRKYLKWWGCVKRREPQAWMHCLICLGKVVAHDYFGVSIPSNFCSEPPVTWVARLTVGGSSSCEKEQEPAGNVIASYGAPTHDENCHFSYLLVYRQLSVRCNWGITF